MIIYQTLKLGFLVLFLMLPIVGMEKQEENYGDNFNRLSPEIREKILSNASFLELLSLSKTSKDWYNTIAPFFLPSPQVIDFSRHFEDGATFKFAFSQSCCWVLAQEYGKSDLTTRHFFKR